MVIVGHHLARYGPLPIGASTLLPSFLGWLAEKPTAHGFRTDLCTARRVADLIRRRFRVDYHPDYLRAWLRQRGYSPQKPRRRAKQKKQPLIDRWVADDWPRIQKKRPTRRRTSC